MSEALLLSRVKQEASVRGWRAYHAPDSRGLESGFPDLVLTRVGGDQVLFIELKRESEQVTPVQAGYLLDLADSSQRVEEWRPSDLLGWYVLRTLDDPASTAEEYALRLVRRRAYWARRSGRVIGSSSVS